MQAVQGLLHIMNHNSSVMPLWRELPVVLCQTPSRPILTGDNRHLVPNLAAEELDLRLAVEKGEEPEEIVEAELELEVITLTPAPTNRQQVSLLFRSIPFAFKYMYLTILLQWSSTICGFPYACQEPVDCVWTDPFIDVDPLL